MITDWAIVAFLVGLIGGCYSYIRAVDHREADKRQALEEHASQERKKLEDCVEGKLNAVQKSLDSFEKNVIDRLARIETGLNHVKKGVDEGSL